MAKAYKGQASDKTNKLPDKTNELYYHLFENSKSVMLVIDPKTGQIVEANNAAAEFYGYTKETLLSMKITDINMLTAEESFLEMKRARESQRNYFNFKHRLFNGETRSVEVYSSVVELNKKEYLYSVIHDATEKTKLESRLSESEKSYRLIFENSMDGIFLTDPNGEIFHANKAATEMLGWTEEEICRLGRNGIIDTTDPRLGPGLVDRNKTGKFFGELRYVKKDGTIFPVEVSSSIFTLEDGRNRTISITRDITEKKKYELKLLESEKSLKISESRYRTLASNIPNGAVVLFDKDLRFILAEGTELARLGLDKIQMVGKTIFETLPAKVWEIVVPHWNATLHGSVEVFEIDFPENAYEVQTVPIRDDLGNVISGMEMLQNITKRKKNERELKQLNDSKDKFFSIISHDLKSPFSSVLGFSEFLENYIDELGKEDIKNFTSNIYKSAKAIFNLLENLLQWSRLQTGRMEFTPGRINLNELIEENMNIYQASSVRKNIRMDCNLNEEIYVLADKNMLDTVLRNILSNSVKYTNHGGTIIVEAHTENTRAVISVTDNGIGISKVKMEKLFILGESPITLGTNNEKGTGLGLLLCKEFIDKNNGEMTVKSNPGKGTAFTFTLPLLGVKDF